MVHGRIATDDVVQAVVSFMVVGLAAAFRQGWLQWLVRLHQLAAISFLGGVCIHLKNGAWFVRIWSWGLFSLFWCTTIFGMRAWRVCHVDSMTNYPDVACLKLSHFRPSVQPGQYVRVSTWPSCLWERSQAFRVATYEPNTGVLEVWARPHRVRKLVSKLVKPDAQGMIVQGPYGAAWGSAEHSTVILVASDLEVASHIWMARSLIAQNQVRRVRLAWFISESGDERAIDPDNVLVKEHFLKLFKSNTIEIHPDHLDILVGKLSTKLTTITKFDHSYLDGQIDKLFHEADGITRTEKGNRKMPIDPHHVSRVMDQREIGPLTCVKGPRCPRLPPAIRTDRVASTKGPNTQHQRRYHRRPR